MAMTEEEKREIAMMTADILSKRKEPKISPDWRKLSKEIEQYSMLGKKQLGVGYQSVHNAIFYPIKFVLRLKNINDMTADQVPIAREIFEFIKEKHKEV